MTQRQLESPVEGWTPRQRQVLDLLAHGYTNPQIAERLGVSLDGAKWHVSEVISKLGVSSREEAADYWVRENRLVVRFGRRLHALWPATAGLKWLVAGGAAAVVAAPAALLVVIAVQAGGDNASSAPASPAGATLTATATVEPTVTAGAPTKAPPGTGIAEVDTVLAAVASGDATTIESTLQFTTIRCAANPQGLGSPPRCPTGTPGGTPLDAIMTGNCEGQLDFPGPATADCRDDS